MLRFSGTSCYPHLHVLQISASVEPLITSFIFTEVLLFLSQQLSSDIYLCHPSSQDVSAPSKSQNLARNSRIYSLYLFLSLLLLSMHAIRLFVYSFTCPRVLISIITMNLFQIIFFHICCPAGGTQRTSVPRHFRNKKSSSHIKVRDQPQTVSPVQFENIKRKTRRQISV